MNKKYINIYLKLINEFNDNIDKWIKYQNYKNIELYIDREHVLDRLHDNNRNSTELMSCYNISVLKQLVKKFLKNNINNLQLLLNKHNPQSFFFDVILNLNTSLHLYFTGELQFNKNKKCFQFCISTFLPNTYNGKAYAPRPAKTDIIIKLNY